MPPLGQALMGLWASEAYSFHSVSTSRFPSILFHNTPGDVYVLQDGRKMRSRLHSDIGRFTGRNRAVKRKRERKSERHRRNGRRGKRKGKGGKKPGQSLLERSSWDLRGYPDYFSHRWFAEYPKNRTTVIKREIASVFTYVPYIYIYIYEIRSWSRRESELRNWMCFCNSPETEKENGGLVVLILNDYLTGPIATHASI